MHSLYICIKVRFIICWKLTYGILLQLSCQDPEKIAYWPEVKYRYCGTQSLHNFWSLYNTKDSKVHIQNMSKNEYHFRMRKEITTNSKETWRFGVLLWNLFRLFTGYAYMEMLADCHLFSLLKEDYNPLQLPAGSRSQIKKVGGLLKLH